MFDEIYLKVSNDLGISKKLVKQVYKYYWKFIKESIKSSSLKNDITEEEFNTIRTNINVPSLGKFYTSYDKILRMREQLKYRRGENVKG